MIDFHSHILPGMDDGSKNVSESVQMIRALSEQGVRTLVATPHYYASKESPEHFCARRKASLERLTEEYKDELVQILPGAEVSFYPGISKLEGLEKLAVSGTSVLLLEMPFTRWSEFTVKELIELSVFSDVQIVLAHIERYLPFQKKSVWRRLYDAGIFMQVNGSFFLSPFTRHRAIRYLIEGRIHFLGSDCHNLTSRPPNLGKAYTYIRKKLGDDFLQQMNEYGLSVLFQK